MRTRFVTLAMLFSLLPCLAGAQAPSPLDGTLFAFPGSLAHPASAASAGLAMADAWLGDEPYSNPAAYGGRRAILSPTLFRVSRQDLRAANRNYDEQTLFLDLAGAAVTLPFAPVWLYVHQPELRFEDFAFNRGTGNDPGVQPATIAGQGEAREGRAGVAASLGAGPVRAGAAFEWTRRQDRYFVRELSGAPDQGDRETSFEGDAMGGAMGLRFDSADSGAGRVTVGLGVRYLPALEVEGDQVLDLLSGASVTPIAAEREAGWEGGVSARYFFTAAFAGLAAFGTRTEQEWKGFDLTSGASTMWRVGMQFHDARDPWTLRFALGQDQQDDAPEPRAGVVGIGFGWDIEGALLDVGVLHRSIDRDDAPRSAEDSVIASVIVGF